MKSALICYYSGTGNTKLACKYIKKHLPDVRVDLFDIKDNEIPDFGTYDLVGFATSTDWGDPPFLVKLFTENLPVQKGKPAFVFNTCAGFSGKTLKTLKKWLNEKGFIVAAGFTLNAPENYPPAIIKGRTKEEYPSSKDLKKFNEFISKLNHLLSIGCQGLKEVNLKLGVINSVIPRFARDKSKLAMGNKYVDESLCNKCGICVRICPYKAITENDKIIFDENKCYGCWSCFNHCTRTAIYTTKIRGRGYYNSPPEVFKQKMKFNLT